MEFVIEAVGVEEAPAEGVIEAEIEMELDELRLELLDGGTRDAEAEAEGEGFGVQLGLELGNGLRVGKFDCEVVGELVGVMEGVAGVEEDGDGVKTTSSGSSTISGTTGGCGWDGWAHRQWSRSQTHSPHLFIFMYSVPSSRIVVPSPDSTV